MQIEAAKEKIISPIRGKFQKGKKEKEKVQINVAPLYWSSTSH